MENILKEFCMENKDKEDCFRQYIHIKKGLSDKLRTVSMYFPHFSVHDARHSENILKYLKMLLGNDYVYKLSVSEMLLICTAAYAHDIGMALSYKMIHEKMTSDKWNEQLKKYSTSQRENVAIIAQRLLNCSKGRIYSTLKIYEDVQYLLEEEFRKEHAKRSAEEIQENEEIRDFLGIRLRYILAEICRLHRCEIVEIMELPYEENGFFDDFIHPRFIAALIALGDLLDMDTERFDRTILNASSPMLELSKIHQSKHESLKHFLVKDGIIEIRSDCKNLEIYREMRNWVDWIKQVTEYMSVHWNEIAPMNIPTSPYLKEKCILLNGDKKWLDLADAKFEISTSHALKLLGGIIYNDKFHFVQELIQNAVDATIIRLYNEYIDDGNSNTDIKQLLKWLGEKDLSQYEIKGFLTIENQTVKFVLNDNGTGISTKDIYRISGVSGKTKEKREFIESMPAFFRPSGIFGIGLQSVFSVADSFEAITRTENEETKRIIFQDVSRGRGYINVTDCKRRSRIGTTIVVYLNSEKFSRSEYGVNDFIYTFKPHENIILEKLIRKITNDKKWKSRTDSYKIKNYEYIPVTVECTEMENYDDFPNPILSYSSIFKKGNFSLKKIINFKGNKILYNFFDVENNCIFNAILINEKDDDSVSVPNFWRNYEYKNSLFYRNVFVKSHVYDQFDYKAAKIIDYKINLLSNNANEILTLARDNVLEKYKTNLYSLINIEIKQLYYGLIDYILKEKNIRGKISYFILMWLYQISSIYNYKRNELLDKYKEELLKIKLDGYKLFRKNKQNQEEKISVKTLIKNENIYFIYEIKIPDDECNNTENIKNNENKNIENKDYVKELNGKNLFLLDAENRKQCLVSHRIKKQFIYKNKGILYDVIVAQPFLRQNNYIYLRDDFVKIQEILEFFFTNNIRCINAWSGYEEIHTFARYVGDTYCGEKRMEIQLDEKTKNKIKEQLLHEGYVKDCKEQFLNEIIQTNEYKNNLKYIIIQRKEYEKEKIVKKYQRLWEEILDLLGKEKFKLYNLKLMQRESFYPWSMFNMSYMDYFEQ